MSMVQELIAAIMSVEREIDQQIAALTKYRGELDGVSQSVNTALAGSTTQYADDMIRQLEQTKTQVSRTIAGMQNAKQKLNVVRRI